MKYKIHLKTEEEIEIMKASGKILSDVMQILLANCRVGQSLKKLDKIAQSEIKKRQGEPSFKLVKGYKWSICSCINDVVVHGIPTGYQLKPGDVVGLDCGVYYRSFHTDSSWTIRIPHEGKADEIDRFLMVGKKALLKAMKQVKPGNYIYDISKTIMDTVGKEGFSVVKTLVGHGIGRNLHENPEVPGFVTSELIRETTPKIEPGLVLAIEVIYNMGTGDIVYKGDDGWTIATKDGKISGLFETTVACVAHGALVLTPIQSGLTKNYGA